jgi:tetratricopeptide (TPR) repeat protein
LPTEGAYVVSDQRTDLLLVESALARMGQPGRHVLLVSQLLPYALYHRELERQYGARWPRREATNDPNAQFNIATLTGWMTELARSNRVFYLHPSMGYYFESLELRPHGLVYELVPRSTNELAPRRFSDEQTALNEQFWQKLTPFLERVPAPTPTTPAQVRLVSLGCARALNTWGVILQRQGRFEEARKRFQQALQLNPNNAAARLSLALNETLRQGQPPSLEVPFPPGLDADRRDLDQLLLEDGPFDHPRAGLLLGEVYVQNALFRQGWIEFARLRELLPDNTRIQLWASAMTAMVRLGQGDAAAAEAIALKLREEHPQEDLVLETLTQVYMGSSRLPEALASIEQQLQVDPHNSRALLNQAAIHIHLKHFTNAIPPLNTLLGQQPDNQAALMNRAIAYLQSDQLEAASRDYQALLTLMPRYHAVYYGLGEIAYRRHDTAAALRHYEDYLKYGDQGSEEYKAVAARVAELKRGAP